MPRTLTLIFCALFATATWSDCPAPRDAHRQVAAIDTVIDGDTVRLRDQRLIRLIGIDTPEVDGPYRRAERGGDEASRWLKQQLPPGQTVTLVHFGKTLEKDRYGRYLAHLYAEQENLQAALLQRGLATGFNLDHDALRPCYGRLEAQARQQKTGLWRYPQQQPISVKAAIEAGKGFRLVQGTVTGLKSSRRNQWLMLEGGLGLYIRHSDSQRLGPHFPPQSALRRGQQLVARGYLFFSHNRWMLRIRHPNDLWLGDKRP
ncbi:thermonuclease family protein [gamma proteobacterium HTCC5015]|nr:thermonuclease family protein [gamma proteobacterium HTCC5015]